MYIRKRGNKWSFTIDIGRDPITNARKQKTVSGFDSEKEAEKAAAAMITDIERGDFVNNRVKLKDFTDELLEDQVKHAVAANTYQMQKAYANNHIYPFFGDILITKVTPAHIQKFYSQKMQEGLSAGVIQNLGTFLGKVFKVAHQWGMVTKNVVQSVRKPTYRATKMKVWSKEQMNLFLKETQGSRFHVVYLLALTTGMRKGEILGLKWENVDLNAGIISVQYTVVYANHQLYLKEPKTAKSKRPITIPEFVVTYLKRYKMKQLPNELDLLVPGINHPICYPSILNKDYQMQLERIDVPKIRMHDMRHTHATVLLQMGENPKVVQERLGHTNIATTMNTYSHVLPSMQKSLADKLGSVFEM